MYIFYDILYSNFVTNLNPMPNNKPAFEKVVPSFGSSILVKKHTDDRKMKKAFWHFHPEIELVYVNKGQGKRHIGNHLSYFNNSQLILLGSNLPHHGFTDRLTSNGSETLIQFKPDFLGETFFEIPEMQNIEQLFERGKKGILFKPEAKKLVGPKIESLINFQGFDRIKQHHDYRSETGHEGVFSTHHYSDCSGNGKVD